MRPIMTWTNISLNMMLTHPSPTLPRTRDSYEVSHSRPIPQHLHRSRYSSQPLPSVPRAPGQFPQSSKTGAVNMGRVQPSQSELQTPEQLCFSTMVTLSLDGILAGAKVSNAWMSRRVRTVVFGLEHALLLTSNGALFACGSNDKGQLNPFSTSRRERFSMCRVAMKLSTHQCKNRTGYPPC